MLDNAIHTQFVLSLLRFHVMLPRADYICENTPSFIHHTHIGWPTVIRLFWQASSSADRNMGMLQVLALQGMGFQGPLNLNSLLHDFSTGSNLRVLDLSRAMSVETGSIFNSQSELFKLPLPPSLRKLNLTGVRPPSLSCCISSHRIIQADDLTLIHHTWPYRRSPVLPPSSVNKYCVCKFVTDPSSKRLLL